MIDSGTATLSIENIEIDWIGISQTILACSTSCSPISPSQESLLSLQDRPSALRQAFAILADGTPWYPVCVKYRVNMCTRSTCLSAFSPRTNRCRLRWCFSLGSSRCFCGQRLRRTPTSALRSRSFRLRKSAAKQNHQHIPAQIQLPLLIFPYLSTFAYFTVTFFTLQDRKKDILIF